MRSLLLKGSNYLLFLALCLTFSAGLVLEYRLPAGPVNRSVRLLGLARHDWMDVHFVCAIALATFALLHLWLNWGWIAKVAARANRPLLIGSFGLGILLLLMPLLVPLSISP